MKDERAEITKILQDLASQEQIPIEEFMAVVREFKMRNFDVPYLLGHLTGARTYFAAKCAMALWASGQKIELDVRRKALEILSDAFHNDSG